MNNPTASKQYVIGDGNSLPVPITVTVPSINGGSETLTINAYKVGRHIFGISVTGFVNNGTSGGNPPFSLTAGNYARFGGNDSTKLDTTAEVVANAFGYNTNTAFSTTIRSIGAGFGSTGGFDDIEFTAQNGSSFQRINAVAASPVSNPYELDSIFIESTSDVDELIMISATISGSGSPMTLFCKRKGNKYFDFFFTGSGAYGSYGLTQDNGGVITGSKIETILGITAISADTHAGTQRCWFTNTSGLIFTGSAGGTILDAIYV